MAWACSLGSMQASSTRITLYPRSGPAAACVGDAVGRRAATQHQVLDSEGVQVLVER